MVLTSNSQLAPTNNTGLSLVVLTEAACPCFQKGQVVRSHPRHPGKPRGRPSGSSSTKTIDESLVPYEWELRRFFGIHWGGHSRMTLINASTERSKPLQGPTLRSLSVADVGLLLIGTLTCSSRFSSLYPRPRTVVVFSVGEWDLVEPRE